MYSVVLHSTSMTTLTTEQKIARLQHAQALLRQHGWCQGNFHDLSGAICASTALAGGDIDAIWNPSTYDLMEEVILDLGSPVVPFMDPISRICHFNNVQVRSVEDVIAQFQVTIDRLESSRVPVEHELVNA